MKTGFAFIAILLACAVAFAEPVATFGIGIDGRISIVISNAPTTVAERRTIFSSTCNGTTYYNEIPMFGVGYSLVTVEWGDFTATYSIAYRSDGDFWIAESMLPHRYIGRTVIIGDVPHLSAPAVLPPPVPRMHHRHRHGVFPPPPAPPAHGRPFAPPHPFKGRGKRR